MTDFNSLPLAEKIKQAQAGDIVVTDSGARLPFILRMGARFMVRATRSDTYYVYCNDVTDIIRPTERKVPEVSELRRIAAVWDGQASYAATNWDLSRLAMALAASLEHGEQP